MKRFLADLSFAAAGALGWLLVQPLRLLPKPPARRDFDPDVLRANGEDIVAYTEGERP